ncbi:MAG: DUF2490 domain-containing protein [Bacteroidota bacterium]|nr:DUF2490 domain-containing protein [Bacteroidota bacterium]
MTIKNKGIDLIFFICCLFILISTNSIYSQSNDAKLWTGIKLEKKISKNFNGSFEIEQRFNNNASNSDRLLFEPEISYKLNKKWSIELNYRIWVKLWGEKKYDLNQRSNINLSFKKKIKPFKIKIASGLQYGIPDLNRNDYNITEKFVSRNSIRIKYDIFGSRFSQFTKYELFTNLSRFNFINYQWRLTFGTSIYLNPMSEIKLHYALEHEYNLDIPFDAHIWAITYCFMLN